MTQVTDAAGNVIADTFDALNRNTARSVSLVTGFQDTTSETRDVRRARPRDLERRQRLQGRVHVRGPGPRLDGLRGEAGVRDRAPYQKVVTTKADAVGNRTYQTYPSGLTLTYAYNDIDALASVTDGTNSIAS